MRMRPLTVLATLFCAAWTGCNGSDGSRSGPGSAALSTALSPRTISDQAHSSGQTGFFWLPPLVSAPTLQGAFDPTQSPLVTITPLTPGAATIATYTTTSGPGSETVRIDTANQNYIVNWHTDQFTLDPTIDYRVAVLIGGRTTGFIDVDVVTSQGQAKNVNTQEYVPLVDGKTLPIKWFMNACGSVLCTASDQCHAAGTCDDTTGTCSNPTAPDGTACNDGNACTRTDTCQAGTCTGANPVVCAATDSCHASGTCDQGSGACSNPVLADGTACSAGQACAAGACLPFVDLGVAITGPANGELGGIAPPITVTATNYSATTAATNATATVALSGTIYFFSSASNSALPQGCSNGLGVGIDGGVDPNVLSCSLGSIPPNGVASFVLVPDPMTLGPIAIKAAVSADQPDPNPANNAATSTLVGIPPPSMSMTSPATVIGSTTAWYSWSYQITVQNPADVPSQDLVVTDDMSNLLPSGSTSASSSQGTCTVKAVSGIGGFTWHDESRCDIGVLAPGASATITLTVYRAPGAGGAGDYPSTAYMYDPGLGPYGQKTATSVTTVTF